MAVKVLMNDPKSTSTRNARALRSRQLLLETTLQLIAREGLHALTHRLIAAEAGLSLSLTTHFFTGLNDLIGQAFDRYVEQALPINVTAIGEAQAFVNDMSRKERRTVAGRTVLHEGLSARLCAFITREVSARAQGIAVELNFLYLHRLDPTFRAKALLYRNQLLKPLGELLASIPSERPTIDAALLLGTIHRLEFDCINALPEDQSAMAETVKDEVERMLALLLRL